jgi:O-antigen ligase
LWFSLALYVLVPSQAMSTQEGGKVLRLAAPFGTPNSLGRAAALVLLLCVVAVHGNTLRWQSLWVLVMGFAALACLTLSQSRTAAVALVGAVTIMLIIERPGRLLFAAVLALCGVLLLMLVDLNLAELAAKISRSGKVADVVTLTGRTAIWTFIWGEIEKSPIFGYGYSSTRYLLPLLYRTFWGWTPAHAHNMWLQTWFVAGLIGVSLLFAVLVAQFRYWRHTRDTASLGLLVFVFVMGLTEAGHLDGAPSILTVLWALLLVGRRQLESTAVIQTRDRPDHRQRGAIAVTSSTGLQS